ncbi:MAG: ABC transporter substrate-binding protein [Chloroflexi bacterium]|nr:ABC transporter substrate-binding protein [Chloroflexota bacterium]
MVSSWSRLYKFMAAFGIMAMLFIVACGSAAPETVEVVREVPVEREVIREVQVEVPVEKEVIREVEVEKTVVEERVKEIQVDKILVATPTPAPAPEAAAQSEGHLRITYTSMGSDGVYPKASNVNAGGKDVNSSMYDVVIGSNAQGAFSKDTGIANDWSVSPDGKVHTINLRQGVMFHNNTEVTSEDVMFSALEVMEEDAQNAFINELTPLWDSYETPDANTFLINCHTPCLYAPWIFSGVRGTEGMVVPKAHYEAVGEEEFAKAPIGSGPYKFVDQVLGASVAVEAIDGPHFRGGAGGSVPKYAQITFLGVSEETTRIAMLKSGQTDVIDVSRERIAPLADDGFNIFYKERALLSGMYFFQQWEEGNPFGDIRVREALNKAINRDAILEHIFLGRGSTTLYPMGSYASESGYDPAQSGYPHDPDRARQLLTEAGYNDSNPLEIKLAIYSFGGIAEFPRMIEAIGADFEAVGVKVNFQPTEYGTLRSMRRAWSLGGGWVGPWGTHNRAAPAEILSIVKVLKHSEAPYTTYKNPEFDAIMNQAFASTDPDEVKALISQMQEHLLANYDGIPLFEVDSAFAAIPEITYWNTGKDSYDNNVDSLFFPELRW